MKNRTWRDIPLFEGYYQASADGLIQSIKRTVFSKRHGGYKELKSKVLKTQLTHNGYEMICLSKSNDKYTKRVHRLIAETFLGKCPNGMVVHHKDHNKLNNDISNLEYVSKQKNTQEYYKTIGKSCGSVPINDIPVIIDRVANGMEIYKIADEYNVSRNDIAVLCKIIALTNEELTIKP